MNYSCKGHLYWEKQYIIPVSLHALPRVVLLVGMSPSKNSVLWAYGHVLKLESRGSGLFLELMYQTSEGRMKRELGCG